MLLFSSVDTPVEFDEVLASLENISFQLHNCACLDELLDRGVQLTRQLFGCDRALIYQFVEGSDGAVTAESVTGGWRSILGELIYDPCFEMHWGEKYRRGEITAIADVEQANLDGCYVELMQRLQVRANLVSPILINSHAPAPASTAEIWGLLIVHQCGEPYAWRSVHRRVIKQIATQMGLAIQRLQVAQQLERREKSQRQWETALEAAEYGIWEWNLVTGQVVLSPQWKALLGYASDEIESSMTAWDALIHPADLDHVNQVVNQHLAQQTSVYRCEYRLLAQDGRWRWVLSQGKVTERLPNGDPLRFLGLIMDISDRQQYEFVLQQRIQWERALNEVVGLIRRSLDLNQIFEMAALQIAQCLESRVRISQYVAEETCWRPVAVEAGQYGWSAEQFAQVWADISDLDNPFGEQLKRLEVIRIDDTQQISPDDSLNHEVAQQFPGQWLLIPIAIQQEVWGAISLTRPVSGRWQQVEIDLILQIADQLAIAIQHASLHQQAQLAHERDALVLQSIHEGIWDANLVTKTNHLSARYWEILGYDPDTQGPTHLRQELKRVHPHQRKSILDALRRHFATRERFQAEFQMQHQGGHYIWVRARGKALWNDQGQPVRMLGSLEDISDRKAMEVRLYQSEEDFRTLVENNPDGILRVDRQFRFVYVNPIVASRNGLSRDEFVGKTFAEIGMPEPLISLWHTAIAQVFETGQEQLLETVETLPLGEHTFYSRIVPEFDDGGEIHSVLIIARDMSNLRAAQEALQHQAEREHTLRLITQHMRETLNLEIVLTTAVTEVQRTLQADRVLIFRLHSDHSGQVIAESVQPEWPVTLAMRWEDEEFAPECYASYLQGDGRIVPDITEDDWGACLVEFMQAVGVQSKMVAPIIQRLTTGPVVWGLLITHACATQRQWELEELNLLQQVADQLAIAIQQSELHQQLQAANQELEHISVTDSLTQISNRRYFDDTIAKEWLRMQREQRELALVLCDIDFFKQYNDTYGHPAGDICIAAVAQALQICVNRPPDCLARYGGEEFAAILPNTDVAGALVIVQNMQAVIAALKIEHQSHEFSDVITLSFGIATVVPRPSIDLQTLIERADRALYQAKQSGRDRCAIAPPDSD